MGEGRGEGVGEGGGRGREHTGVGAWADELIENGSIGEGIVEGFDNERALNVFGSTQLPIESKTRPKLPARLCTNPAEPPLP